MRPWRQVLAFCCSFLAIICILYSLHSPDTDTYYAHDAAHSGRTTSPFSFQNPSSFFPPTAIISLTDENTTYFLARPAAFGPILPEPGLSGQLWVGSGFGDDNIRRRGIAAGAEGELGCSDVPGLPSGDMLIAGDGNYHSAGSEPNEVPQLDMKRRSLELGTERRRELSTRAKFSGDDSHTASYENDGTDDHLHNGLSAGSNSNLDQTGKDRSKTSEHADIQSLQESAEIAGKVVLLSRGGCGFSEKVKWAQRRGATAVIIGDNIRGGPLVRMNAWGDTSNITIPSLFTSHTTAHLLSSLIPPGFEFIVPSVGKHPKTPSGFKSKTGHKDDTGNAQKIDDQRTFTLTPTATAQPSPTHLPSRKSAAETLNSGKPVAERSSWLHSLWSSITFGSGSSKDSTATGDSRRPPSSGQIDWFMVEDWDSDEPRIPTSKSSAMASKEHQDGFVIGVQDWRDPDVVGTDSAAGSSADHADTASQTASGGPRLSKGAITPGSGEYAKPSSRAKNGKSPQPYGVQDLEEPSPEAQDTNGDGWLSNLGWNSAEQGPSDDSASQASDQQRTQEQESSTAGDDVVNSPEEHEGLWVTLTPTTIGTSPFFDTLIVLVVSPLVTLTIVYSMLLLRSRIRRRRWRAPKSLVERLPVRTYHTQPTRSSSPAPGTSTAIPCTSTTPLLPNHRPVEHRSRPRSRTISGLPDISSPPNTYGSLEPSPAEQEKLDAGLAEWRRRYGGKQVECVVCLEEYVDGVSKVMSLPCGHEFHADCITPWLTTRRRTCPICKGDVVRSMTNSSTVTSPVNFTDETDEEVQVQAAETNNTSPTSAMPIDTSGYENGDLERGEDPTRTSQSLPVPTLSMNIRDGFQNITLSRHGHQHGRRPPPEDRNR